MAIYILDTSTFTLIRHNHARAHANIATRTSDVVGVTSINVEEVLGGWFSAIRRAKTKAQQATASQFLADATMLLGRFVVYPLTETAIDEYDRLVRLKLNVGAMDLKIAAVALELGATIVTNNLRDFGRVPGLVIEDWSV